MNLDLSFDEYQRFQPLIEAVDQLTASATLGQSIGAAEGGQIAELNESEFIAAIGSGVGSRYAWRLCSAQAVAPDGTIGTDGPAPVESDTDATPNGSPTNLPAYEIKGRTDVPSGTRVFLRRSIRGPFYEFHYDGPGSFYYGYSSDIPPRYGSVSWSDDRDVAISGCTFSKVSQTHTLSVDGTGRLVIVDTLTPVSYTIGPFPLHGNITIPSQTGSISGTAGSCAISGTVTVPSQVVALSGQTACP